MTTGAEASRGSALYEHTQRGWLGLIITGAVVLSVVATMLGVSLGRADARVGSLVTVVVLLVLVGTMVVFSSLTIRVDHEMLSWHFGPGAFRKRIALAEIASASVTRTSAWSGIGIRWRGNGWLYNVASGDAVEIVQRDGTRTWLGTDEPRVLHDAVERARGR